MSLSTEYLACVSGASRRNVSAGEGRRTTRLGWFMSTCNAEKVRTRTGLLPEDRCCGPEKLAVASWGTDGRTARRFA